MTTTTGTREVRGVCPLDCPDSCAWTVTVQDGRAVRLAADREHPHTRGALCVKMNRYLDYTYRDDRLLHPLRRVGAKGEGRFERISWDDALGEIASRWTAIIDRHGPQAIWPYFGVGSMGIIQGLAGAGRRLWNVLGTSQHQMTICTIAGGFGTGYMLGDNRVGIDPATFTESRLIILWGANPLSTGHHFWKYAQAARRAGAHVVVIDPIRTKTAERADEHLAPAPGSDAALAFGLMHVILDEGAQDDAYLAEHALGWPELRERILEFPPARAAEITGIEEERIVALGRRIAHTRPTGIKLTPGLQRHAGGGNAVRAITCIPTLTGDWRHPGGGAGYDTRGFFGGDWQALWRDDLRPPGTRNLSMTRLAEGLLEVDDPPVASLFVYASNPLASVPSTGRIRRGLLREDLFTVVVDHFQTDTVDHADIVLPGTMQTEHADLQYAYGHIFLSWNEPAVAPPGECRSHTEIFRGLARALGLTEPCLYDDDDEMARQVLGGGHPSLEGVTLERLKREGWVRLSYPTPFVPFADGFPTPSGRFEMYSERAKAAGHDPLPAFVAPVEARPDGAGADRFPLMLLTPAAHHFLNSMFANVEPLAAKEGRAHVVLHPEDAAARGLADGDAVRVFNDRGAFVVRLVVSDAVRRGVAASPKGHWPKLLGGPNVNVTVDERDSDMGGGAVFHDNRVEVAAA